MVALMGQACQEPTWGAMAPGFADRAVQGVNFLPLRLQCCTARRLCAQPGAVDCLL